MIKKPAFSEKAGFLFFDTLSPGDIINRRGKLILSVVEGLPTCPTLS